MKPEDAVIIKTLAEYGKGVALLHHHELQPIALAAADHLLALSAGYEAVKKASAKAGHWIIASDGYYPYCSQCNQEPKELSDFCPHCGADMRGPCAENTEGGPADEA